jgi:hypothetical protein
MPGFPLWGGVIALVNCLYCSPLRGGGRSWEHSWTNWMGCSSLRVEGPAGRGRNHRERHGRCRDVACNVSRPQRMQRLLFPAAGNPKGMDVPVGPGGSQKIEPGSADGVQARSRFADMPLVHEGWEVWMMLLQGEISLRFTGVQGCSSGEKVVCVRDIGSSGGRRP